MLLDTSWACKDMMKLDIFLNTLDDNPTAFLYYLHLLSNASFCCGPGTLKIRRWVDYFLFTLKVAGSCKLKARV